MDVEQRVEELTRHVKDPIEKARKQRILTRALMLLEKPPEEILAMDNGSIDGIPFRDICAMNSREKLRLEDLKTQRDELFELGNDPVVVETEQDLLNKPGKYGYTPLILAVVSRDYVKIRELLERGVNTSLKDNGDMTAMDKARRAGDKKAMILLLRKEIARLEQLGNTCDLAKLKKELAKLE